MRQFSSWSRTYFIFLIAPLLLSSLLLLVVHAQSASKVSQRVTTTPLAIAPGSASPKPVLTREAGGPGAQTLPTIASLASGPGLAEQRMGGGNDVVKQQQVIAALGCARRAAGLPPLRVDTELSQEAAKLWSRLSNNRSLALDQVAAGYSLRAVVSLAGPYVQEACQVGAFDARALGDISQISAVGIAAFSPRAGEDYSGASALIIGK